MGMPSGDTSPPLTIEEESRMSRLTLLTLTVAIFLNAAIDAVWQPAHPSPPPA